MFEMQTKKRLIELLGKVLTNLTNQKTSYEKHHFCAVTADLESRWTYGTKGACFPRCLANDTAAHSSELLNNCLTNVRKSSAQHEWVQTGIEHDEGETVLPNAHRQTVVADREGDYRGAEVRRVADEEGQVDPHHGCRQLSVFLLRRWLSFSFSGLNLKREEREINSTNRTTETGEDEEAEWWWRQWAVHEDDNDDDDDGGVVVERRRWWWWRRWRRRGWWCWRRRRRRWWWLWYPPLITSTLANNC